MSKASKVKMVSKFVRDILELEPTEKINHRDNDESLAARYWHGQLTRLGYDPRKMTANDFLSLYTNGSLTPADDLTRARRLLQAEDARLRGSKWSARHKEAIDFKNEIND